MPLETQFQQTVAALQVPQPFAEWLDKQSTLDAEAFALLAATEGDIQRDIVEVAKAEGVDLASLAAKVNQSRMSRSLT